jgi:hypothetical protein
MYFLRIGLFGRLRDFNVISREWIGRGVCGGLWKRFGIEREKSVFLQPNQTTKDTLDGHFLWDYDICYEA